MPYTFERGAGRSKRTHTVYTAEEAQVQGLTPVPNREAQAGSWALTDDGFVAECLRRKTYVNKRGRERTYVRLSFGSAWLPGTRSFAFLPYYRSGHYGGTTPKSWSEREARRSRTRLAVRVYVEMLLSSRGVDWNLLGVVYRPKQEIPEATVRRLFKQKEVQEMVKDEIRRVLEAEGLTETEVVRMYKKAFDKAEETGNPSAMRAVAKDLSDMLGMNQEERRNPTDQYDYTRVGSGNWDLRRSEALLPEYAQFTVEDHEVG